MKCCDADGKEERIWKYKDWKSKILEKNEKKMKKVYIKETRTIEESENYRHVTNQSPHLFVQKMFYWNTSHTQLFIYSLWLFLLYNNRTEWLQQNLSRLQS